MINYKGEKMNKSELIEAIAHGAGVTKVAAGKIVEVLTHTITNELKKLF